MTNTPPQESSPQSPQATPRSVVLAKAKKILEQHKLEIAKDWLTRLVDELDDLEALERFPTQESIRASLGLIEGLAQSLVDEEALKQFEEGGIYFRQAEAFGLMQPEGADAIVNLARSLGALEDAVWERLAANLRQQDADILRMARVIRQGLHRVMAAAALAYHQHSKAELSRMAHTDPLTGLYNRRYWEPELARHVEIYKRYRRRFAILMIDFDNLKSINDTFGHAAGDSALAHLAAIMRSNIREVDIPCRYGGDEFLILMPEADGNAISLVGQRISQAINNTRFRVGQTFASLEVSFGVAACPEDGINPEELLKAADTRLYEAKQRKAGRFGTSAQASV